MTLFPPDSAPFPSTYRQLEIQRLARWINAGQSGSVIGLPGCGRSNLLEFLCSHPTLCRTTPSADFPSIALIPVNLYTLPALDMATFLSRIVARLLSCRANFHTPALQVATARFYRENMEAQDHFCHKARLMNYLCCFSRVKPA
jgi:hypothetical protein